MNPDSAASPVGRQVSPWAISLGTGVSAAAVAATVVAVIWFATRSLASIQEQELFEMVSPMHAGSRTLAA